jgi:hypothetical protein
LATMSPNLVCQTSTKLLSAGGARIGFKNDFRSDNVWD